MLAPSRVTPRPEPHTRTPIPTVPDPQPDPFQRQAERVAVHAVVAGAGIAALKFTVFAFTDSVAVLSDALESLINIAAAVAMLYAIRVSNRPADHEHPYGHGKAEFMAVALEGWLILIAGVFIAVKAAGRLISGEAPSNLGFGIGGLAAIGVLDLLLAVYVSRAGRRYNNPPLAADGKHLFTDVLSTAGVIVGLALVHVTGRAWLDPVAAIVIASLIFFTSWRLLWQSVQGLMDRSDPEDQAAIRAILDRELAAGRIHGYHKVRHRHQGRFHWVDMHLQVDPGMSVADAHALASRIEAQIEAELGPANATAHIEPKASPPSGSP